MGNELFWATSQEQRGFKDTAAHSIKFHHTERTSVFQSSKGTPEISAAPSESLRTSNYHSVTNLTLSQIYDKINSIFFFSKNTFKQVYVQDSSHNQTLHTHFSFITSLQL